MAGRNVLRARKPKATNFVERVRGSTLILAFGALAGALTVSASTTDSVDKLLVWAGLKKNALQLAEDDKRGEFSRALTRLAWKRLFWTRRVILTEKYSYDQSEKDKTWDAYLTTVDAWNENLMINIVGLNRYYLGKGEVFEGSIQPKFGTIHYCLERIRHPSSNIECKLSPDSSIGSLETAVDELNFSLYGFVCGLSDEDQRCSL
ncbi:hypothetical protein NXC14_PA00038 (plasmid) [Rhizobium sp. NXC14]|uniref:hypothetical protein n=1 Tax=Rhizobium sp. NXC14 TaxID=1981173 RepID=UPI000A2075F8|nr:hypothetical protein [Rhizobium sp. NXC14]ARO32335.1 hypothetical protein NXC14_PA00038 [Rhizobium sp. NXC14]